MPSKPICVACDEAEEVAEAELVALAADDDVVELLPQADSARAKIIARASASGPIRAGRRMRGTGRNGS
jgi:hypothetical protein